MYTNLEKKHIEDDVGKNHRSCDYFKNGICQFYNKNCIGSSNCGSLFVFKKRNKISTNMNLSKSENFGFDVTKKIYHVKIIDDGEILNEKIYIGNNNAELNKKGYICVKYDTPVALYLKDCNIGFNFSININENIVFYEVLDIKFLNDNLDEIVFENTPKRKEIEKHIPNTIITKEINQKDNVPIKKHIDKDNDKIKQKPIKQPIPSNYNLSTNDLSKYQKYKNNKQKIDEENLELERKKDDAEGTRVIICVISFIVTMILGIGMYLSTVQSENDELSFFPFCLIIGLSILISYIAQYIYKQKNPIFYQNPKSIDISDYFDNKKISNLKLFYEDLSLYEDYDKFTNIEYWNTLNGYEFEIEVAELFKKIGYKSVRRTQGSYDGGVDISMEKNGKKYAVQCKHHARPVGAEPLRALHGILDNYDEGIFVSLNGYTQQAKYENNSWSNSLKLYNLNDLIRLYKEYFEKIFQESAESFSDIDEWVYDDIFTYGMIDLKNFAKDVDEEANVYGKTKNELIKIILKTLTIEELEEMCSRYNIIQDKEDIINLIIKNKKKMK